MSVGRHQNGISLVELLLAISLAVVVAFGLSLSFTLSSKHNLINRQRWIATNLANTQIQEFRSQPYAYLNVTPTSVFPVSNPTCDCRLLDFSALPSTGTVVAGTFFVSASSPCIHYVTAGTWASQCTGDTGYKNIVVRTSWALGSSSTTISKQFVVSNN